ncbi:restriction endonuclease subunit S [Acidaminococcus timonensis]
MTLPPLDEQQKIVQFLDRFDRQNDKVNILTQPDY